MSMSNKYKASVRKNMLEKHRRFKETEKAGPHHQSFLSKHLNKVYPIISLPKTSSSPSLLSSPLDLSQNSNDSSTNSLSRLQQRITLSLRRITPTPSPGTKEVAVPKSTIREYTHEPAANNDGFRRCNWITKHSDTVYIRFHDERWGVPVYDDNHLFELLAICGMLMDYSYTEILKRTEKLREAFKGFDPRVVAKMGEKEIAAIASNKEYMLAEGKVRCIINNANRIITIVKEFGSLSSYFWDSMNHKPIINGYRHPKSVPLRTPKAEAISKDLVRREFRLVGPVIVYSFMQAAGMTMDHLVDCFRYNECASLADAPWNIF